MKFIKAVVMAGALAAAAAPGIADAHGGYRWGGWGLGLGLGLALSAPVWAGYYAPRHYAPAYYAPPYAYGYPYAAPSYYSQQPTYLQQSAAPVQQQANLWYYCASSNGYYPYVRDCATGWQAISPRPPGY